MDLAAQPSTPSSPSALDSSVKEALGCMVLGAVLSTGLYGISVLQGYMYFKNSGQDTIPLRALVSILSLLDTISMILIINSLYDYVVADFWDPLSLLHTPPILALENGITILVRTLTQCFFAHQLWTLSQRNVVLVGTIVVLALCSCGTGMAISVDVYTHSDISFFGSMETRLLSGFANGLSVVCDVVVTGALWYYLRSKRTGFKRTDSMIQRLIIYAINRGTLTAVCQTCQMVTTIALPGRFLFIPFVRLAGKLYCNTLLATLNARESMRRHSDSNNVMELSPHFLGETENRNPLRHGHARGTAGRLSVENSSGGMPESTYVFKEISPGSSKVWIHNY